MIDGLVEQVLAGRRRAVARAISLVENDGAGGAGGPGSPAPAHRAGAHRRRDRAAGQWQEHAGQRPGPAVSDGCQRGCSEAGGDLPRVGIIAVDPTSPFSGGAILGDRIRMRDLAGDRGIFIRSMASRGNLGGLAWATADAVKVLDAAGYDLVIVETVGAGQAEVDIARTAHTTVVVEVPGLGDDIQAIKAGILEIADVFAVNKADLEGADRAVMALRMMLDLGSGGARTVMHHGRVMEVAAATSGEAAMRKRRACEGLTWQPPIHKTVATRREGIPELAEAILAHRATWSSTGGLAMRERERAAAELENHHPAGVAAARAGPHRSCPIGRVSSTGSSRENWTHTRPASAWFTRDFLEGWYPSLARESKLSLAHQR